MRPIFLLLLATGLAHAGDTVISERGVVSDEGSVTVDEAGYVHIRTETEAVDVANWREGGDATVIVRELGGERAADHIRLSLDAAVLFDTDSSALQPEARAELDKVATVIKRESSGEVIVVGHTDSRGSAAHNDALSRERALTVIRYLSAEQGVPAAALAARGMGSHKPIADESGPDAAAARAKNRRVEVYVATRDGADLHAAIEGTVVITDDAVRTGDVTITEGGVNVGGVDILTTGD